MDFATYIPLAIRTAKMFPSLVENLQHSAIGLFTEGGEIASEIKRVAIYDKPLTDEMRKHLREEIGDAAWYVALGCSIVGVVSFKPSGVLRGDETLTDVSNMLALAAGALAGSIVAMKDGPISVGSIVGPFSDDLDMAHDVLVYLCKMLDFDFGEVLDENIAKLRLRYPDKYSDEAAEARADKGGLDHRSS